MQALLTVEQLSKFLHKSVASIRSDSSRNPQSLPPICRLPGTKRLLWRIEDVEQWLAQYVAGTDYLSTSASQAQQTATPKRGRPTKAEQVAKQKLRAEPAPNLSHTSARG